MQIHSNRFLLAILIDAEKSLAVCQADFSCKDLVKSSGFRWDNDKKIWFMSLDYFRNSLDKIAGKLGLCEVLCQEFITGIAYKPPACDNNNLTPVALSALKIPPYSFQATGINFAITNPYAIIGDEMGLGKTPQAIGVLAAYHSPSIVLCPASLKLNWVTEIEKFYGAPTFVLEGKTKIDSAKMAAATQLMVDNWPVIFILNYEILDRFDGLFAICKHWVIDEAHALKNPDTERTTTFRKYLLAYRPTTCTFLTGTAITKSVSDFFTLLSFCALSPKENGPRISENPKYSSWFRFSEYFSHARQSNFGTQYKGVKNWPELRKLMEHKYLRRSAKDYLPDLPSLTRAIFMCKPDDRRLREVDQGLQAAYEMMRNGGKCDPETDVCISSAKRGASMLKTPFTAEIAQGLLNEGEKVIIFSDHVETCKDIKERLGKTAWLIIGATSQNVRQHTCETFQDKDNADCMAIVATYGALNAGRTLTAARVTLANDLPWLPSTYLQAEKRFHRIGQTEKCVVKIISAPGFDIMINKSILSKSLVLSQVLSYGQEETLEFKR